MILLSFPVLTYAKFCAYCAQFQPAQLGAKDLEKANENLFGESVGNRKKVAGH